VKFAGNTVWSVPERFWGGVPRRGAISSVLTFTFTFYSCRHRLRTCMCGFHGHGCQFVCFDHVWH